MAGGTREERDAAHEGAADAEDMQVHAGGRAAAAPILSNQGDITRER